MGKMISFLIIAVFLMGFVSASSKLDIESVTLEEPKDGIIEGKDTISIKAVITNSGDEDLIGPFTVWNYVNGRLYSTCSGKCELNYDIPVSNGLKVGQKGEFWWAGNAYVKDFLREGENEVSFVAATDDGSQKVEKSILFEILAGNLNEVDLGIKDVSADVSGGKLNSVTIILYNNGPNAIEDDTVSVGFSLINQEGLAYGTYGWFLDLRKESCSSQSTSCYTFNVGEEKKTQRSDFFNLNNQIAAGTYTLKAYLEDVNGLEKYTETNNENNVLSKKIVIEDQDPGSCEVDTDCPQVLCAACLSTDQDCYCPETRCIDGSCELCKRVCKYGGTKSEGWYDSCTGKLISYADCDGSNICADKCGNGVCDEIVCTGSSCPCPENEKTCPKDCAQQEENQYRYAKWSCYDGSGSSEGSTSSCKSSETWKKYAEEYCEGRCYSDKSKCGVNSFSVSQPCSSETPSCVDSDDGKDIYTAGDAFSDSYGYTDNCEFLQDTKYGILNEAICDNGELKHVQIQCPKEAPYCRFAVCTDNPMATCKDSDGGITPGIKGTIKEARYIDGPSHTDYCENLKTFQPEDSGCEGELCGLREYYCPDEFRSTSYRDVNCPSGCYNGVCKDVIGRCIQGGYQCDSDGKYIQKCDSETGEWYSAQYCEYGCKGGECVMGSTCGDMKCTAEDMYSCAGDCDIFERYLILKDIGGYVFKYASLEKDDDSNYGTIVQYSAVYSFKGNEIKAGVIELESSKLAEKAFMNEILREKYSVFNINKNKVFMVDNDRKIAWLNSNKIIFVDTLKGLNPSQYTSTQAIKTEELPSAPPSPITGSVVGAAISRGEVVKSENVKLKEIKSKLVEDSSADKSVIPKELISEYVSLYPSLFVYEPVCGDGICDYSERSSCSEDCEVVPKCKPISSVGEGEKEACIEKGGKWVVEEDANGCLVAPYCVAEDSDDEISEMEKLAVIMKLEKLSIKIRELRNTAKGLAEYYSKIGEDTKAEAWSNAADDFDKIILKISSVEKEIKDSGSEQTKEIVKNFLSTVKERLKAIINNVISGIAGTTETVLEEEV